MVSAAVTQRTYRALLYFLNPVNEMKSNFFVFFRRFSGHACHPKSLMNVSDIAPPLKQAASVIEAGNDFLGRDCI